MRDLNIEEANDVATPFALHLGDCIEVMRTLPENSVDAIVTDPPYGIRFMGKAWDGADIDNRAARRRSFASHSPGAGPNGGHKSAAAEAGKYDLAPAAMKAFQEFSEEWAREALRILKPGGHLLSFSSPRTYHRMASGIEDAGFEMRDQIMWVHSQGFPKSHNGPWGGTALKPAHEPICMARKPLIDTVAANFSRYGTGALNIDVCRVDVVDQTYAHNCSGDRGFTGSRDGQQEGATNLRPGGGSAAVGRWPANLIHDGSAEVIDAFPDAVGQQGDLKGHSKDRVSKGIFGDMKAARDAIARVDASTSAARFFYCAKASRSDRNEGCASGEAPAVASGATMREREDADWPARNGNHHPTVKPTGLMAYLARLVTPAGGVVLDPFMGSGSTGKACMREGLRFIGIDMSPEYVEISRARIEHEWSAVTAAAAAAATPAPQRDLFEEVL